jgi:DNA/RNA endonuclease G (NUC1)
MKKIYLFFATLLFVFFSTSFSYSQKNSIKIEKENYTCYFDTVLKQPLLVMYKLYKGGGDCSRAGFSFKNDLPNIKTATQADYAKSGYDRGHLANAEDFAYDCKLDELTFRYYNCLPQSKNLNRGLWKQKEEETRQLSQIDTIVVICFGRDFFQDNKLNVPRYCGKIVKEKNGKIHYWLFDQNGTLLYPDKNILKEYLKYLY